MAMASVQIKIIILSALSSLVLSEPPVQGYNYRRPSYNNYTPRNTYVPPTAYTPPSNQYLPPTNVGQTDYDQSSYSQSGFNHAVSQTNYNQASYEQPGHDYHGHDHGHDHSHDHGHDHEVPKSYEFGYSVKDAQSGNDYNRKESSDGNVVRGEYRVQLPDGRTQIVTYHADWKTGFHADVRYEGEAQYPEPAHNNNQGSYNYNTPDYSGSLTGFQSGNSYKPASPSYLPPAKYNPPSTSYGTPSYH